MRIEDCLPLMTKSYLARVVDSIVADSLPRGDEERLREQVRQNHRELADPARLREVLDLTDDKRANRILMEEILVALLESPDLALCEEDLYGLVRDQERAIVEGAANHPALEFTNPHALETYRIVLEVALDDDVVTADEFAMLERLRIHLGISRLEHRLLEAGLGKFPKPGNTIHSFDELREASRRLQTLGVLFYCNKKKDGPILVLPEESAPPVRAVLGFEMREEAQRLLHDSLKNENLRLALKAQGLPLSGSKSERSDRLISAGVKASEVIAPLSNEELGEMCRDLQGVAVSGSKQERRDRIIKFYGDLTTKQHEESDDPRAVLYQYYEEYARRETQTLYQRKLIKSDREIDGCFEEATRYIFEVKLGISLLQMPGSEHPDGGASFPNGELLLWDNKSTGSPYKFPISHSDQFRRYIKDAVQRVNVFLVISSDIEPEAKIRAMKLKHKSGTDTDVAVISAEDLKYLAETWRTHRPEGDFDLEVFNATGILDRTALDERMAVLLG